VENNIKDECEKIFKNSSDKHAKKKEYYCLHEISVLNLRKDVKRSMGLVSVGFLLYSQV
jgi:hypothetical protein